MDLIRALFGHGGHKTPKQHSERLKPGCAFFVRSETSSARTPFAIA